MVEHFKNNRETKLFFRWRAKTKWRRKTKTTFLFATLRLILIGEWQSSIFFGCWKTKNYYSNVCIFRETAKITRITRTRLRDRQHTEKKENYFLSTIIIQYRKDSNNCPSNSATIWRILKAPNLNPRTYISRTSNKDLTEGHYYNTEKM